MTTEYVMNNYGIHSEQNEKTPSTNCVVDGVLY